jgi:hypothetical protein
VSAPDTLADLKQADMVASGGEGPDLAADPATDDAPPRVWTEREVRSALAGFGWFMTSARGPDGLIDAQAVGNEIDRIMAAEAGGDDGE